MFRIIFLVLLVVLGLINVGLGLEVKKMRGREGREYTGGQGADYGGGSSSGGYGGAEYTYSQPQQSHQGGYQQQGGHSGYSEHQGSEVGYAPQHEVVHAPQSSSPSFLNAIALSLPVLFIPALLLALLYLLWAGSNSSHNYHSSPNGHEVGYGGHSGGHGGHHSSGGHKYRKSDKKGELKEKIEEATDRVLKAL